MLSYVQEKLADIWKENVIENLEGQSLEYKIVGNFLADLKKKFGKGDNKTMKVAELKIIEKESREIEEFMQEFIRVARGSGYEERSLVKEFKRGTNGVIRRKLIKVEHFQEV